MERRVPFEHLVTVVSDLLDVHRGHLLLAGARDRLGPRGVGLQPADHIGHLIDRLDRRIVHARHEVALEEFEVERVASHPDDDRAREEEVLELVRIPVRAHVERVLVPAELLKREAASLDEHAALRHVRLAYLEARGRRRLDVHLVDEEELGVALRLVEDGLSIGARLHVAREDGAVDAVAELGLPPEREQLRVRELPARRLERMCAWLAAPAQRREEGEVGPGQVQGDCVGRW